MNLFQAVYARPDRTRYLSSYGMSDTDGFVHLPDVFVSLLELHLLPLQLCTAERYCHS